MEKSSHFEKKKKKKTMVSKLWVEDVNNIFILFINKRDKSDWVSLFDGVGLSRVGYP